MWASRVLCILTWERRSSSTRDRCVNYRLGQAICRRNGPPAGWRTCAGKARYDRSLPNDTAGHALALARFLQVSDSARVSVSTLLRLVGPPGYLSMRLCNKILFCMIQASVIRRLHRGVICLIASHPNPNTLVSLWGR